MKWCIVLLVSSGLILSRYCCAGLRGRHREASLREQVQADAWLDDNGRNISSTFADSLRISKCPCEDPALCINIQGPPILPTGEFFAFGSSDLEETSYFNWTYLSTVAWSSDAVMCEAHRNGARAVISTPTIDLTVLKDATKRKLWVTNVLFMVRSRYMDGVTFDYEEPMEIGSSDGSTYVQLVYETAQILHQFDPSLQVTVCVAWASSGIDSRYYPVKQLSEVADALYVMDYDTQSQILFGPCVAAANAPFFGMIHGVNSYRSLGIPTEKLILGVPWYGYRYPCNLPINLSQSRLCPIPKVSFRGVPCSDAAGSQVPVLTIWKRFGESNSPMRRDETQESPFFSILERDIDNTLTVFQYWFDDPASLRKKFSWAGANSLAGVGPYALSDMDPRLGPSVADLYTVQYWSAFESFYEERPMRSVLQKNVARDL